MPEANVYLNGKFIGLCSDPLKLVSNIRELRAEGKIPSMVNVAYYKDTNEVVINCDAGRVRRPLMESPY